MSSTANNDNVEQKVYSNMGGISDIGMYYLKDSIESPIHDLI